MKKLILSLLLCLPLSLAAQTITSTNGVPLPEGSGILDALGDFFRNNPSNNWDVTTYALYNVSNVSSNTADGLGAGVRVGYWFPSDALKGSVGAAVDLSYNDHAWTAASVGLAGRGTIRFGDIASVTLHAVAGPGWNIHGAARSIVAVVGTGGNLHINKLPWVDFFGEYQHLTTSPEAQDRVLLGVTYRIKGW